MSTAHLYRVVQDGQGNALQGATVTVCSPGTQAAISETLYLDQGLTEAQSNPFTVANGVAEFYLAQPKTVALVVAYGGTTVVQDYIDVLPLAETIMATASPLTVINDHFPNALLQAIDASTAQWVDVSVLKTVDYVIEDTASGTYGLRPSAPKVIYIGPDQPPKASDGAVGGAADDDIWLQPQ